MADIDDGGPVFPQANGRSGMTMRDLFAMMALPQIQKVSVDLAIVERKVLTQLEQAEGAYRMADAMLAARKEQG